MADTNVLTHSGKAIIANRMLGAGTEPKYIGWGTGAGTAAEADTDLSTPTADARVLGTTSRKTTVVTNDTYEVDGTMIVPTGQTRNITNAGTFDAASGGNICQKISHDASGVLSAGSGVRYIFQLVFKQGT